MIYSELKFISKFYASYNSKKKTLMETNASNNDFN